MTANSWRFLNANIRAATAMAVLLVVGCVPPSSTSPQQVKASNPSVSYTYHNDQELLQANQKATTYCSQYQSTPRTSNFTSDADGGKVVNFECIQSLTSSTAGMVPVMPTPMSNSNLIYNYRTDQELLDASRNAQTYCVNNGASQVMSSTVINPNGSKTVTFQCSSR